ncbi:hypothetical protein [Streptomyces sp. NPDC002133]|uniref:Rv1733c family protein n=1 Tax=Streptomyces sp. NPDC002133 TaxID=3154409 RepID=UPI00331DC6C9
MSPTPSQSGENPHRTTLRRHLRRAAGRDPSPLTRRADRSRSRAVLALVASLPLALAVGSAAGVATWETISSEAGVEAPHRHHISARTVTAAERDPGETRSEAGSEATARVVWRFPPSRQHTGTLHVPSGTPAGTTVKVWVDDAGDRASPPRSDRDVAVSAAAAGLVVGGGLSLAACGVVSLRLRVLESRTLAQWEREWEKVEPLWTASGR